MTSNDIYIILSSKPHNVHHLNRYWKFIQSLQHQTKIIGFTENHHICPKAKDLFPEYKKIMNNNWNSIHLSRRQHWIAHWMLSKVYGNSQTIAFFRMCAKSNLRNTSRTYDIAKIEHSKIISNNSKGMAVYIDSNGIKIRCSTTDQRVLSGELISSSKGRRYAPRTEESKKRTADAHKKRTVEEKKLTIELNKKARLLKTPEDIMKSNQKMSESCKNRTKEQREAIQQKRSQTALVKTEEVKQVETAKRVSTYKETIRLKKLNSKFLTSDDKVFDEF